MRSRFSFLYVDIQFDVLIKGIFMLKNVELVFLCTSIFMADTKIAFGFNFGGNV